MAESLNVNFIDEAEYPSTTEIHNQCALPLARHFCARSPPCSPGHGKLAGQADALILGGEARCHQQLMLLSTPNMFTCSVSGGKLPG